MTRGYLEKHTFLSVNQSIEINEEDIILWCILQQQISTENEISIQSTRIMSTIGRLSHYLRCAALHCTALHCTALHCTALHCTALHCTALHCTALHCTALHCTALHCTALHCTALHCTALHCTALHCIQLLLSSFCLGRCNHSNQFDLAVMAAIVVFIKFVLASTK